MKLKYISPNQLVPDDHYRICVHEAGHAAVGASFRMLFDSVSVGPGEFGIVEWTINPIDDADLFETRTLPEWLLAYAAGSAAEQLIFGEIRDHARKHDLDLHDKVASRIGDEIATGYDDSVLKCMDTLTSLDIKQIADRLETLKRLDFDAVCAILNIRTPWD